MSDSDVVHPAQPVIIVAVDGETLQLHDGTVLYRFVPLKAALKEHPPKSPPIPWRDHWPEFTQGLIDRYSPLPPAISSVPYLNEVGPDHYPRLGEQNRADPASRQATYNGWPLYTCLFDSPGQAVGTIAGFFEPVRVTVAPLLEHGYSYPPTIGGP